MSSQWIEREWKSGTEVLRISAPDKHGVYRWVYVCAERGFDAREAARQHLGLSTYEGMRFVTQTIDDVADGETVLEISWTGKGYDNSLERVVTAWKMGPAPEDGT